jgi:hypothetical protein
MKIITKVMKQRVIEFDHDRSNRKGGYHIEDLNRATFRSDEFISLDI